MNGIKTSVLAACVSLFGGVAMASVSGNFDGPPDTFSINLNLSNAGPASILSIVLDGSTGDDVPILWDFIGTPGGTASLGGTSGEGTQIATLTFLTFGAGDTFTLTGMDPDGDPAPASVEAQQLSGVTLTAVLSDNTTFVGSFVDDPNQGLGPILRGDIVSAPVPLPAALPLMAVALGGLGMMRRFGSAA